jgi:V/A-type H+/Na+-transporting ATPase subunit E
LNEARDIAGLEAALLARAEQLAAETVARGEDGRKAVLRDEQTRLDTREERITREARAAAERLFRQRVQAVALRLTGDIDRLRWSLIEEVLAGLPARLEALAADSGRYEPLVEALLSGAAANLDAAELVATLNTRDTDRLQARWTDIAARAAPGRKLELGPEPGTFSGGVRVASRDGNVRIDATFEGRIARFRDELAELIAGRLFADEAGTAD